MSMTKSRDRADATREAASTRRARSTGRGGPRFLPYSGVNQPSHGGTGTPTADPAGVRQASAGPARPPTDVYQPSLGANPLRRAQPRLRARVLHPFNYTTRKYVPQAHNLPPNGGRSTFPGSRQALLETIGDDGERPDRNRPGHGPVPHRKAGPGAGAGQGVGPRCAFGGASARPSLSRARAHLPRRTRGNYRVKARKFRFRYQVARQRALGGLS